MKIPQRTAEVRLGACPSNGSRLRSQGGGSAPDSFHNASPNLMELGTWNLELEARGASLLYLRNGVLSLSPSFRLNDPALPVAELVRIPHTGS